MFPYSTIIAMLMNAFIQSLNVLNDPSFILWSIMHLTMCIKYNRIIMRIKYESLAKEIFIGMEQETTIRIWDGSDWQGWLGIWKLKYKGLVEIDDNNCITMHNHLRDLGKHFGIKESLHRLWCLTDNLLHDLPHKSTVRLLMLLELLSKQCYVLKIVSLK